MCLVYGAAIHAVNEVADVEILLSEYFFRSFVPAIEFDPQFVVHVEYVRIVVQISASIGDEVEVAKSLFEVMKTVLHHYRFVALLLNQHAVFGEMVEFTQLRTFQLLQHLPDRTNICPPQ